MTNITKPSKKIKHAITSNTGMSVVFLGMIKGRKFKKGKLLWK